MIELETCAMQAVDRGQGSGSNWGSYNERLAQAAADAETFGSALQQAIDTREVTALLSSIVLGLIW